MAAFLNDDQVRTIRAEFGSPVYVYDQRTLEAQAEAVLNFPNAFGLTARYAMKALPNSTVIRILTQKGLHIDASSGYEAERAMRAGVPGPNIMLTAQQIPKNLKQPDRTRRDLQCVFSESTANLWRPVPRAFPLRADQSRPGIWAQQAHQCRRSCIEFWGSGMSTSPTSIKFANSAI